MNSLDRLDSIHLGDDKYGASDGCDCLGPFVLPYRVRLHVRDEYKAWYRCPNCDRRWVCYMSLRDDIDLRFYETGVQVLAQVLDGVAVWSRYRNP